MTMTANIPPVGTRCLAATTGTVDHGWQPITILFVGKELFLFTTPEGKEICAKRPDVWLFKPDPTSPGGRYKLKPVRDLKSGDVVWCEGAVLIVKAVYFNKGYRHHKKKTLSRPDYLALYTHDHDRVIFDTNAYLPARIDL